MHSSTVKVLHFCYKIGSFFFSMCMPKVIDCNSIRDASFKKQNKLEHDVKHSRIIPCLKKEKNRKFNSVL